MTEKGKDQDKGPQRPPPIEIETEHRRKVEEGKREQEHKDDGKRRDR